MKTKLSILITTLFFLFTIFALPVNLQSQTLNSKEIISKKTPPAEEKAKALTDKMKETLSLNDEQYKSIYNLNLDYAKKNEILLTTRELSRASMFKKISIMQEVREESLKSILTTEQFNKYKELINKQETQMKEYARNR